MGVMRERIETRPGMLSCMPTAALRDYRAGSLIPILTSCLRHGAPNPVHSNDKNHSVVQVFAPDHLLCGVVSAFMN